MRFNDERRERSGIDVSDTRSADTPSDERLPVGRHRAPAPPHPVLRFLKAATGGLLSRTPVRMAVATGLIGCLGFVAFTESKAATPHRDDIRAALADRLGASADEAASRGMVRTPIADPSPTPAASATPQKTRPAKPAKPKPVAGLDQAQMDNAYAIVQVGLARKLPRRALIIAIATAMQESNLYNLASEVLPESKKYPHQGTGWDHDSVGLFQQRTSSGWGAVADLMRPAYAAEKFFAALEKISGWQSMSLTAAAQAVQASAFPYAYAKWEGLATKVVDALT